MSAAAQKTESTEEMILRLERDGYLDPTCAFCRDEFYPSYRAGKGRPFAPGHKPSPLCDSGKRPHCTCDSCF